jgi:putative heme-binding domain-containing protein
MAAYPIEAKNVWQLIAFIRSVNAAESSQTQGDPDRGAKIFTARGCVRCHTAGGEGGFVGPDLGEIGTRRNLAYLERAILEPNADVSADYWSLQARTKSGKTVGGIRLNEDTDWIQYRDPSGKLRSVRKADLAAYEIVRTSPMPSFKNKLQSGELDDLLAFLVSRPAAEVK